MVIPFIFKTKKDMDQFVGNDRQVMKNFKQIRRFSGIRFSLELYPVADIVAEHVRKYINADERSKGPISVFFFKIAEKWGCMCRRTKDPGTVVAMFLER